MKRIVLDDEYEQRELPLPLAGFRTLGWLIQRQGGRATNVSIELARQASYVLDHPEYLLSTGMRWSETESCLVKVPELRGKRLLTAHLYHFSGFDHLVKACAAFDLLWTRHEGESWRPGHRIEVRAGFGTPVASGVIHR